MLDILVAPVLSLPNIGAYAILAVGIVMIYRASKVLNLAHGAMAMIPPYIVYSLNQAGLPALVAVPIGIAAGGALGWLIERLFVRRLRSQGVTAQTVGTVAALGFLIAAASKIWGTTQLSAVRVFPQGRINVAQATIGYGEIALFAVMLVVTGALLVLFQKTDLGLLMRGTAENRRAASLMGVDPDRITALAWVMGGALAGLSGIMLASVTNLHPFTLSNQALPAFVAALLGGLASISGAVIGAAAVGLTWSLAPELGPIGQLEGSREFFIFLVAIAVMVVRGRRLVAGEDVRAALASDAARRPLKLPGTRPVAIAGLIVFALFGIFAPVYMLGGANKAAIFLVVSASLVVLTGWVGQISLGHAALVGLGAYATGWLAGGLGIPFPLNMPLAGLAAAGIAALLGAVAVRVRGLYLAVATLIFSWAADSFLFRNGLVTKHFRIDARPIGSENSIPYFDFSSATNRTAFFFVAFAVAGLILYAAANLKDSKTGRALFAVRGSELAASSLGIDVIRYKVLAFSVSGFMAGVAGVLVMTEATTLTPDQFAFDWSFFYLAIAVVGGLTSLGGAVAAAMLFGALEVLFFRVQALSGLLNLVSTGLLAVVLLAYSGGMARAGRTIVEWIGTQRWALNSLRSADRALDNFLDDMGWFGRWIRVRTHRRLALAGLVLPAGASVPAPRIEPARTEPLPIAGGDGSDLRTRFVSLLETTPLLSRLASPSALPRPTAELLDFDVESSTRPELAPNRDDRPVILEAESITVQFGGLTAVNDVSLQVREGEIVGLIGPNGAGKSVTFNSIAGIVTPTMGHVRLWGRDVTELPVHERAQLGVARTFQQIQLIPQLSAFDNLLVATHLQNPTGFLSHIGASERAVDEELHARARVERVVDLLDLGHVANLQVADLPFGVLRMIEVARAMVTGFRFMMLDEPASGLDSSETEGLIRILYRARDLGVTLLLIEHDVKMVTSMSDYMYVLDRGQLISQGLPADVQRDPAVVAAYLGQPAEG